MSIPEKTYTLSEVQEHNNENSAWIAIHGNVYDVSEFMVEHPGGAGPLIKAAGKDGTQAFEDEGHSEDARNLMKDHCIGKLDEGTVKKSRIEELGSASLWWLLPFGIVVTGLLVYQYVKKSRS